SLHSHHHHNSHPGLAHSGSGSAIGGGGGGGSAGGGAGAAGTGGGMTNNSGGAGGGSATSAAAAAAANNNGTSTTRYALAEFRYGREEMLALFDLKTLKGPEILVNYKHLYVEKPQPPLALTPCPEEELVAEPDPRRIWQTRSISTGIPSRGAGRGVSVDRGRGRGRGVYTSYTRSTSFYDDESRGVGRGERPWLERNGVTGGSGTLGGGGMGDVEWNSSSSSPRKDFGSRIRSTGGGASGTMESWRRSRTDDDTSTGSNGGTISGGDWRSGGGAGSGLSGSSSGGREKWTRSTSWRDEDGNSHHGLSSSSSERMISVPPYKSRLTSSTGHGNTELHNSSSGGSINNHSLHGLDKRRQHYDADELPEWATENPCDFGGSFDATGAFHDSDNDEREGGTAGNGGGRTYDDADDANGRSAYHSASSKAIDRSKPTTVTGRRAGNAAAASGENGPAEDSSTSAASSLSSSSGGGVEGTVKRGGGVGARDDTNHSTNHVGVEEDTNSSNLNAGETGGTDAEQQQQQQQEQQQGHDNRSPSKEAKEPRLPVDDGAERQSRESVESGATNEVSSAWQQKQQQQQQQQQQSHESRPSSASGGGGGDAVAVENAADGSGSNQQRSSSSASLSTGGGGGSSEPKKSPSSTSVDRMQEVADDMVAQLIMDDEFLATDGDPSVISSSVAGSSSAGLNKSPVFGGGAGGPNGVSASVSMGAGGIGGIAGGSGNIPLNMMLPKGAHLPIPQPTAMHHGGAHRGLNAHLMPDPNNRLVSGAAGTISQLQHQLMQSGPIPGADVWFYRDPQGKVQGPFPASEMTEWYRAGYFDDSLSVRRACDEMYTTLGTLVTLCSGAIPFLNSMSIPPIKPPSGIGGGNEGSVPGPKNSPQQQQQQQQQPSGSGQSKGQQSGGQQSAGSGGTAGPQPQQQPSMHPTATGGGGSALPTAGGTGSMEHEMLMTKRLHIMRQQHLLLQKLNASDGWHLLPPEQQNVIIAQQMAQLMSAEGMVMSPGQQSSVGPTPPGAGTAGIFGAGSSAGLPIPGQQDALVNMKLREMQQLPPQPTPPSQLPLLEQLQKSGNHQHNANNAFLKLHLPEFAQSPQLPGGGRPMIGLMNVDSSAAAAAVHDPLSQLMHGINFNQPPVQSLGPLGPNNLMMNRGAVPLQPSQPQQTAQQGSQPHHSASKPPSVENDPLQLFMQLSLHKNQQSQLPSQQQQQQPPKSAAELITPWLHTGPSPQQQQQQQQAQQPPSSGMAGVMGRSGGGAAWGELPPPPASASFASLMQQQQQQSTPQQHPVTGHPLLMAGDGSMMQQQQQSANNKKATPSTTNNKQVNQTEVDEKSLREQQEQQQLIELQSQLDSKLKWNAQNLVPANVKPLAEIQAEEAAAAERAREKNGGASGLTVAAIAAQPPKGGSIKKEEPALSFGSAVWQGAGGNTLQYWNSSKAWGGESATELGSFAAASAASSNSISSAGGFWEEPVQPITAASVAAANPGKPGAVNTRKPQQQTAGAASSTAGSNAAKQQMLSKSKTMGSISTSSSSSVNAAKSQQQKQQQQQQQSNAGERSSKGSSGGSKAASGGGKNANAWSASSSDRKEDRKNQNEQGGNEFTSWCSRALSSLNSNVDIPTFVGFLQDIESPYEVKDYIRLYLGETKECSEFSKQYLERRSKYKNQQRQKNAHIDDMCKPAPAINPSANDFQEIKGKGKKIKKIKMHKLDNRILGFSVTAAPDRLNVGDRDYGDNA
uniref:GYF domain-containing protein n=1 Tax=Anopheles albimanus TaxID=7167 RepID=A0A182FPR5_ANOAL